MKSIFQRAINVCTIFAGIVAVVGFVEAKSITERLFLTGVPLAIVAGMNYIFFGKLTLWHKD